MTSAADPSIRRIPPPRIYVSVNQQLSTIETKQTTVYENDHDHEKCLIQMNELRELNRRHLVRIQLLENDYRQLDDDIGQLQNERDLLLKQKRTLEEEVERSSRHASDNIDLHIYIQNLENECRDLRSQINASDKDKHTLTEMIADFDKQLKQACDQQDEWREAFNQLESVLAAETEKRQYLEVELKDANIRQKENEDQIRRLKDDLDEMILTKQEVVKSNYVLVQNAERLREQLRIVRTQAAEVRIISASSSTSFENLDESLPCLVYDNNDHSDSDNIKHQFEICQSSLFNEINSLETIPNETLTKCLDAATNDIELDVLLSKTTTLSSSLSTINQLINEVNYFHKFFFEQPYSDDMSNQEHLSNMNILLKTLSENMQLCDTRFRKLQLLLIASREQQLCYQAELDDFYRLIDKRLLPEQTEPSKNAPNQEHRLVYILEVYEQELDRLRRTIRNNDDNIRSLERQLVEQQNTISGWRMKNTFLEKNQRKLMDKIKELNNERRQTVESSAQKRNRRRAAPSNNQIENKQQIPSLPVPLPSKPIVQNKTLSRCRSLPNLKSSDNDRQSYHASHILVADDNINCQLPSINYKRRRMKTTTSNQIVVRASSHVCFQDKTNSIHSNNSKHLTHISYRFHCLIHILFLCIITILFSYMKSFPCDN